jgi:hypothetical protein
VARGKSGRVVVEVDPDLKLELYTVLTSQDLTLKEWFVREAERFIRGHRQPSIFDSERRRGG